MNTQTKNSPIGKFWYNNNWINFKININDFDNILEFLNNNNLAHLADMKLDFSKIPSDLHGKGISTNLYNFISNNEDNSILLYRFFHYFIMDILKMKYDTDINLKYSIDNSTNWRNMKFVSFSNIQKYTITPEIQLIASELYYDSSLSGICITTFKTTMWMDSDVFSNSTKLYKTEDFSNDVPIGFYGGYDENYGDIIIREVDMYGNLLEIRYCSTETITTTTQQTSFIPPNTTTTTSFRPPNTTTTTFIPPNTTTTTITPEIQLTPSDFFYDSSLSGICITTFQTTMWMDSDIFSNSTKLYKTAEFSNDVPIGFYRDVYNNGTNIFREVDMYGNLLEIRYC